MAYKNNTSLTKNKKPINNIIDIFTSNKRFFVSFPLLFEIQHVDLFL
jgi:hypothetical protein